MGQSDIQLQVAQPLFRALAADGSSLQFATLTDGRCAILRNGAVEQVFPADVDSVHRAVSVYQRLTHLSPDDGAVRA